MSTHASRVRAVGRLIAAREMLSDAALELAYHLAVPVVVSPAFVHLVRLNFFVDPPVTVTYEDEARLLLSPLCRDVGNGFYDIDPDLRTLMIVGLTTRFGPGRLRHIAVLLERYTERGQVWGGLPELEQAQRLTALSLLKPEEANSWLAGHEEAAARDAGLRPEWFVAMRRRISDRPEPERRLEVEIAQTWCMPTPLGEALKPAALNALMSLPSVSGPRVASVLRDLADGELSPSLSATLEILDPAHVTPALASPVRPPDPPSPAGNVPDITPGTLEPPLLVGRLGSAEAHEYHEYPARAAPVDAGPAGAVGRIAIVGAPGAGKTTFAAALNLAALGHAGAHAYWSLHRAPTSEDPRLLRAISQLRSDRFPSPVEDVEPLEFRLVGHVEDVRGGLFTRPERRQVDCTVEVHNVAPSYGRSAAHTAPAAGVERLADARALLYLVDPVRELTGDQRQGSNFQFFSVLLEALMVELDRNGRLDRGHLPHHVAVCLTKFDHPEVFERAVSAGLVAFPDEGGPHVPDDQAVTYLDWLCESAPSGSSVSSLRDGLRACFHADRIAYFVTSAVGFYRPNSRSGSLADHRNVVVVDGQTRLRGPVRPLNVVEPLLHLERDTRVRH